MRSATSCAPPLRLSRRASAGVRPRVPGLALRGRRFAGARFFAMHNYRRRKKAGRSPLRRVMKNLVQALFFARVVAAVLAFIAGHLVGAVEAGQLPFVMAFGFAVALLVFAGRAGRGSAARAALRGGAGLRAVRAG